MIPIETNFESQVSLETEANPVPEIPPFYILFLGDYSGRHNLSNIINNSLVESEIYEIDRDNFDDVLKRLNVSLRIYLGESNEDTIVINFRSLDDFHPDNIFRQLPVFRDLRETRNRLLNPDTFDSASREVNSWFHQDVQVKPEESIQNQSPVVPSKNSADLLDEILGESGYQTISDTSQATEYTDLKGFIRDVVKPHIIQTDEVEQSKLIATIDEIISQLMCKILHHPDFQNLESAWRGLYFATRRIETSNDLKLFLMDISKEEISDDLKSVNDLTDSDVFRKIVVEKSKSSDNEPFALICGNYEFELNVEDVATLIRFSKIGNSIVAPFIAQIKPQMFEIESLSVNQNSSGWNFSENSIEARLWTTLREFPEAKSLGFVIPNFLSRLPYGVDTEPTEVFSFEEFADNIEHKNYLWTNASFICAVLFAQNYRTFGWELGNGLFDEITGLPVHIYEDNGEIKTNSCVEINFNQRACETVIEQGLMPLISFRNTDSIKLADIQSVSSHNKVLKGRWA